MDIPLRLLSDGSRSMICSHKPTTHYHRRPIKPGARGVLAVLVPRGVHGYSTGTAQAVLDLAAPGARLVFSCGWHISRDGHDVYSRRLKWKVAVLGGFGKRADTRGAGDRRLPDTVGACTRR